MKTITAIIFFCISFIFISKFSFAQTPHDTLYKGSTYGTFNTLDSGVYEGSIYGLYSDTVTGLLHLGGNFDSCGYYFALTYGWATYDGKIYHDKAGFFGEDRTRCIIRYGDHVYAAQSRTGAVFQDTQSLATRVLSVYDDTDVTHGEKSDDSTTEFCIYQDKLYVGGQFNHIVNGIDSGLIINGITYWDGSNWHPLGKGVRSKPGNRKAQVYAFAVWHNILYVGGRFDSAGDVPAKNFAKWDGQTWSAVDDSGIRWTTGFQSRVRTLYVWQDKLLIGGSFNVAGNDTAVRNLATLDTNGVYGNLGIEFNGMVDRFQLYNGALYIGGHFKWPNPSIDNHLVVYKNGVYYKIADFNCHHRAVTAFALWRGQLIIGGCFNYINESFSAPNIIGFTTVDADIMPTGPTTICGGESVGLNAVENTDWSYQWRRNDTDIAGATNSSYSASQTGSYRVYVHNTEGDTSTTWAPVNVTVAVCTGVDPMSSGSVQLYPNPTAGNFVLEFSNPNGKHARIELENVLNQVVRTYDEGNKARVSKEINTSGLSSGVYNVKVTIGNSSFIKKLVIEK